MRVVLAGGGTAGHIEPALNTADGLKAAFPSVEIIVLGTERGLETSLVPARGYELTLIPPVPMPRRFDSKLFTFPKRFWQSIKITRKAVRGANVVVGFGGYVATPAYLAARLERIPIVVHEANAKPGIANRLGAIFAAAVVETVAGSIKGAANLGLPLRKSISDLNRIETRPHAIKHFGLDENRPTLLVFGGSQGARSLNSVVSSAAGELISAGWQILHSVGKQNPDFLRSDVKHYVTVDYISEMSLAYAASDVALTRAGAMTVAELTAVGIPSIYVPLPIGNGEQRLNALPIVAAGGGVLISDADLNSEWLSQHLANWQIQGLEKLAAAAKSVGRQDATAELVNLIAKVAKP